MFPDVFHHFSKDRVIHQFEEIFLKVVHGESPKLCLEIRVGFHPIRLTKPNHSMNSFKYKPMPKRLILHSNVDYVILLISKIWNHLFSFVYRHLSHINGRSLWESCNSVGYLTWTSSRCPLILLVARVWIWLGSMLTHLKLPVESSWDINQL